MKWTNAVFTLVNSINASALWCRVRIHTQSGDYVVIFQNEKCRRLHTLFHYNNNDFSLLIDIRRHFYKLFLSSVCSHFICYVCHCREQASFAAIPEHRVHNGKWHHAAWCLAAHHDRKLQIEING